MSTYGYNDHNHKSWRKTFREITPDRWIELIFAGAIVFFAFLAWRNSKSTTTQTDQLITAANTNAKAATNFATSAQGINAGVSDAVGRLNLQADALKNSVQQASRLADDTEKANQNVVDADRPWLGGTIAVTDFEVGKVPKSICNFVNSGRRPAIVQQFVCSSHFYGTFPDEPHYGDNVLGVNSRGLVLPGAYYSNEIALFSAKDPLLAFFQNGQPTLKLLETLDGRKTTLFVYSKLQYTDVKNGTAHFTHTCVQYNPASNGMAAGFYSCPSYNEAD